MGFCIRSPWAKRPKVDPFRTNSEFCFFASWTNQIPGPIGSAHVAHPRATALIFFCLSSFLFVLLLIFLSAYLLSSSSDFLLLLMLVLSSSYHFLSILTLKSSLSNLLKPSSSSFHPPFHLNYQFCSLHLSLSYTFLTDLVTVGSALGDFFQ